MLPIMASSSSSIFTFVVFVAIFSALQCSSEAYNEFQVGDSRGWVVPPPNDTNTFNDWASRYRFHIGDSLRFRYKKDSVMEVGEENYKNCNSTHPTFFSNIGNTLFKLNHSGTFYFISGATGHCEKGQRMILRVMVQDDSLPHHHSKSSGSHLLICSFLFVFAFLASFLI